MTKEVYDEEEKVSVIKELIAMGALFSSGREWSPEEVVEYLVERGVLDISSINVISWYSPDSYAVRSRRFAK